MDGPSVRILPRALLFEAGLGEPTRLADDLSLVTKSAVSSAGLLNIALEA